MELTNKYSVMSFFTISVSGLVPLHSVEEVRTDDQVNCYAQSTSAGIVITLNFT